MDDTLSFRQLDDVKFLRYMAGCKAYATTAGFESVCEAMYPALYREGRKRGNLFRGFLFLPSFLSGDLNAHVHRIGSQCPKMAEATAITTFRILSQILFFMLYTF